MLAVYGHVITWKHLILTAGLLLVLMTLLAGGLAWWGWQNLAASVVLREQQADIRLPPSLAVEATVTRDVQVRIDQTLPVRVPIRQDLLIPLPHAIPVKVSIDTEVPIAIDVPVRQTVRIDQTIDVNADVRTRVLGIPLTLPIQGRVPVQADVPIDVRIPVRHTLPVALVTEAEVRLTEPLRAHVDTVIEAEVPLRESLKLPVTRPLSARLTFPERTVRAGLSLMAVTVPLESVTLGRRHDGAPLPPAGRPASAVSP